MFDKAYLIRELELYFHIDSHCYAFSCFTPCLIKMPEFFTPSQTNKIPSWHSLSLLTRAYSQWLLIDPSTCPHLYCSRDRLVLQWMSWSKALPEQKGHIGFTPDFGEMEAHPKLLLPWILSRLLLFPTLFSSQFLFFIHFPNSSPDYAFALAHLASSSCFIIQF